MPTPTLSLSGDEQQVILNNGDLQLSFYRNYGGAPLRWRNSINQDLVAVFAGEGVNIVADTGNDPTQASADGLTTFPIARIDSDPDDPLRYYGAETIMSAPAPGRDWAEYETFAHAPYFWASLDRIDDCHPVDLSTNPWNTIYNNFRSFSPSIFTGAGTPLIFAQRGATTSGIILIGDEIKQFYNPSGVPWNQAYTKIHNGNFACRMRVQLTNASVDGIAGILFRKLVPTGENKTLDDLYLSPGYALNINKSGIVQFVKDNVDVLWTAPDTYGVEVNSLSGLAVELRTDAAHLDKIHVYLNGVFVDTVTDLEYTYDAFGLFAQATEGDIRFLYREVIDNNIWFQSTWRAYPDYYESICKVLCEFYTPMYRLNLPVIFIEPLIRSFWEVKDNDKVVRTMNDPIPFEMFPGILDGNFVSSIWIGQENGSAGIAIKCDCNMHGGHVGINPANVAFNTLPYDANFNPVSIQESLLSLKYRTTRW